ncbi:hypothetical protein WJM97_00040 [Okeanomitos corallinicola TIOX110]|uniref:Periplasmic heavy metal sensor n=1 Tax=Okeanomitos corallinicola TIOX110 TaxID=3133117 RepID=A0ABZ2USP9_9CYAN
MLLSRASLMTFALVVMGNSLVWANPSQNPAKKPDQNVEYLQGLPRDLELKPKQLEKIQEIRRNNPVRERMQKKRQELREANQEFLRLIAGNATKEEVRAKYRQINSLREQVANAEFEDDLEIREILNNKQRRKWSEHLQKRFPAPPNLPSQPR